MQKYIFSVMQPAVFHSSDYNRIMLSFSIDTELTFKEYLDAQLPPLEHIQLQASKLAPGLFPRITYTTSESNPWTVHIDAQHITCRVFAGLKISFHISACNSSPALRFPRSCSHRRFSPFFNQSDRFPPCQAEECELLCIACNRRLYAFKPSEKLPIFQG